MIHDCKVIEYCQCAGNPEQEITIFDNTDNGRACLRVWQQKPCNCTTHIFGIKYCPFCGEKLEIDKRNPK